MFTQYVQVVAFQPWTTADSIFKLLRKEFEEKGKASEVLLTLVPFSAPGETEQIFCVALSTAADECVAMISSTLSMVESILALPMRIPWESHFVLAFPARRDRASNTTSALVGGPWRGAKTVREIGELAYGPSPAKLAV